MWHQLVVWQLQQNAMGNESGDPNGPVTDPIQSYRALLVKLQGKMQEQYDKTVLTLSGGAIGLSLTFAKDFLGIKGLQDTSLLFYAWWSWGLSVSAMLASFFTSSQAMGLAIRQTDQNLLYSQPVGGFFDMMTRILNIAGGLLFFAGVVLMAFFVKLNLK